VALNIFDAAENGLFVVAETFIVAIGPDRSTRLQAVANCVFGTFRNFPNVIGLLI